MRRSTEPDREDRDIVVPPEDLIIATAGYARWQVIITAILCLTILVHMMDSSLEAIHHMAGWWCEKPATLRGWTNAQWIMFSHVNATRRGFTEKLINDRFRGCHVYKYNFTRLGETGYDHRPQIASREAVRCAKIHYSRKFGRTIAEKYNKACDPTFEYLPSHFFTLLGQVLGYLVFGCLSDRVGRRPVLFAACGLTPLTGIALVFSPSYVGYLIARTLHSVFHSGFVVSFILLIEITNNVWRTRVAAVAAVAYGLGIGVTPLLFKALASVDHLTLLVNVPCLGFLLAINTVPESPPWLFCMRDSNRLKTVIRKAAKTNGNSLPNDFRVIYVDYTDVERQLPKKRSGFWNLFQTPDVACEMAGIAYLVVLSALINGGAQAKLIYNEKRVDRWYSIIGLDQMSSIAVSQFCVLMMGHRKLLQVAVFLVLITTGALMANLREDYITTTGPATTILAANVFVASLTYGVILNYSVRTVPTLLRGTYLGMWTSLWVTFTWLGTRRYLNYPGISSTVVITILVAALSTLNIRDLLWRELPDTVIDALNFKDKPKPKRWSLTEAQVP